MKKHRMLISILFFVLLSIQIYSQTDDPKTSDQEELENILKNCAAYCEKLAHSVLDFVCLERISEEINTVRTKRRDVIGEHEGKTLLMSSVWEKKNQGRQNNCH